MVDSKTASKLNASEQINASDNTTSSELMLDNKQPVVYATHYMWRPHTNQARRNRAVEQGCDCIAVASILMSTRMLIDLALLFNTVPFLWIYA